MTGHNMEVIDELKANNKCETCKSADTCGSVFSELISPDDVDELSKQGIKVIAVVYSCKFYTKR